MHVHNGKISIKERKHLFLIFLSEQLLFIVNLSDEQFLSFVSLWLQIALAKAEMHDSNGGTGAWANQNNVKKTISKPGRSCL